MGASVINADNKLITSAHIGRIIWINQKIERKANTATNTIHKLGYKTGNTKAGLVSFFC